MSYIYKQFETGSIAYDRREFLSRPIWSNNLSALEKIYTSSIQSDLQKLYYIDVYNNTGSRSEKQFSIVYADYLNSGSSSGSADNIEYQETKALYLQYKQLLLNSEKNLFEFMSQVGGRDVDGNVIDAYVETSDYIYVLNINRSRYKERLAPGSWQLSLQSMNPILIQTSESKVTTLVDETLSNLYSFDNSIIRNGPGGQFYYVYSGSLKDGLYKGLNSALPYGIVYPESGIIVLNGKSLDASASLYTHRNSPVSSSSYNNLRLFTSISGALSITSSNAIQGRTLETINSTIYFARIGNGEFNYSNNITYYQSGSEQYIKPLLMASGQSGNVNRNVTYITTVGLYNNEQDLLAVAKLSKPVRKTSSSEVIIKIKLDY
jgi:hypothetical protein